MPNSRCCRRCCRRPSQEDGRAPPNCAACSTGCSTSCAWRRARPRDARPARRPPSSTARASRRRKGGAARLGCRQEGERPQAPHRGRYARLPARRSGPPGRYSGPPRRRFAVAPASGRRLAPGRSLRRQRLCRPDGRNRVSGAWRLPDHHHRQGRRRARLSRAAKALGGRAHPRLALSKPPSLQGLRTSPRRQRSLCQTRDDPPHDRSIDMNHTSKTDSEVFPVFGREIVECEQGLAILCQALGGLFVFQLVGCVLATMAIWKSEHREFYEALVRGGSQADANIAESLYRRGMGYEHLATKIFMPAGAEEPVYAPYVEHYPPDTNAALGWLSRRQPTLWKERQEVDVTATVAHRIAQMTPEQRARDALDLVQRARQRLAEWRQTIEHEAAPEK